MALFGVSLFTLFSLLFIALFPSLCFAADPSVFYDLCLSYITESLLDVPQQVHFLALSLYFIKIFFPCGCALFYL